jgi:hypothetical protein
VDEGVEKMTMKTRYGSYKFLVMPFGLCNVLLTFTTLMNSNFPEKLDEYIGVLQDNERTCKTLRICYE